MTATAILETLAKEFGARPEQVQRALELVDAGLCPPYIARFRRADVGDPGEGILRRVVQRRRELEELERRRGTILRALEAQPGIAASALDEVRRCMDRFDLEDLFLPHRRPEPEVQLALDRGLGGLADRLVAAVAPAARGESTRDEEPHEEPLAADAAPSIGAEASAPHESESALLHAHESEVALLEASDAPDVHASAGADQESDAAAQAAGAEQESDGTAPLAEAEPDHEPGDEHEHEHEAEQEQGRGARPAMAGTPVDAAAAEKHLQDALHRLELTPELARACADFVLPDRGVHSEQEALSGAMRILSDRLGRNARLRGTLRRIVRKHGVLVLRATADDGRLGRFKSLVRTRTPLSQLQGQRLIAIRQAQRMRLVAASFEIDRAVALPKVRASLGKHTDPAFEAPLALVAEQALERRLLPMIEEDVRLELKERGDDEALRLLANHLRQILGAAPAGPRPVAGVDVNPKGDLTLAPIDARGMPIAAELRVEVGEKDAAALGAELAAALAAAPVDALVLGHGKAGRAAAPRLRAALAAVGADLPVFLVNEAGLASYANSELARAELPEATVLARRAVSLGRRLQDPLSEMIKVDPRFLGLGLEQGLVSKAALRRALDEALESVVAHVGCDLNAAGQHVLTRVPGLNAAAARKIVEERSARPFESREDLRSRGILSEAQWTSAVAFLRVPESGERLDACGLHPEQYALARRVLESTGQSQEDVLGRPGALRGLRGDAFEVDESTWFDLVRELGRPGRDPRPRLRAPALLPPGADQKALAPGGVLEGIVSNLASFGVFVDVGLAKDALVHVREIADRFVRDAREALAIGQVVRARVVEGNGQRLILSLRNVPPPEDRVRRSGPRRAYGESGGAREGGAPDERRHKAEREGREERGERGARSGQRSGPAPVVRAAQTRRDGKVVGGGERGERRGGKPGRGGAEGGRPRPGGRPDSRGGRRGGERDEAYDPRALREATRDKDYRPFESFFKSRENEPPAPPDGADGREGEPGARGAPGELGALETP